MSGLLTPPRSVNERLDALERRVGALDGQQRPPEAPRAAPNALAACCARCGVCFSKTMLFACPYHDCPSGFALTGSLKD